jgi:ElaA protein
MTVHDAIGWKFCAFNALGLQELHDLLQLRTEVFVVEQNCVFQDIDGTDAQAFHLLGLQDKQLVAYARCFPAGVKFAEASIGRVITRASVRGTGVGHRLIDKAIESVGALWGPQAICIGAQARLAKYYSGHGFVDLDRPYVEDGIDHLEMRWQPF